MKTDPNNSQVDSFLTSNAGQYTKEKKRFSAIKARFHVYPTTRRSRKIRVLDGQVEVPIEEMEIASKVEACVGGEQVESKSSEQVGESLATNSVSSTDTPSDRDEIGGLEIEGGESEETGVCGVPVAIQIEKEPFSGDREITVSEAEPEMEKPEGTVRRKVGRPRGSRATEDSSSDEDVVGRRVTEGLRDELTGLPINVHHELIWMTFYMLPIDMDEPKGKVYSPEEVKRIKETGKLCRILPGVPLLSPESCVRVGIIDGHIEDLPIKFDCMRSMADPRSRKKGYLLGPGKKPNTSVLEIYSQVLESVAVTRVWRQIEGMGGPDLTELILNNLEAKYQLDPKSNMEVSKKRQTDGGAVFEYDSQNFDADGEPLKRVDETGVDGRILREGVTIW